MRLGIAAGAMVLLAALLAPGLLRPPTTSPAPSSSGPVAAASPTTGPSTAGPTAGPSATPEPWADLDVPPFTPLAELAPVDADRLGVARDTAFTLHSLTATPAVKLAAGLRTEPDVALVVKPGPSADIATVRPATALDPGQRYRFHLTATDGSLIGSWVFTARGPLNVVATIPGDHATGVPLNTGIEVTFDQDGTTGVPTKFAIEPAVAGRFEQHGRTWAFVPDDPLASATIYTVTVRRGVGVAGSDATLGQDVAFQFETGVPDQRAPLLRFGRVILEIRPGTTPDVAVWVAEDESEDRPRTPASVFVTAHRLPTFRAVVEAAAALAGPDSWAMAAPSATVDTTGLTRVARVESPITEQNFGLAMRIPAPLDAGFYVLTIEQPGLPAQALVQVTDLSAYALTASRDTVVWVNDLASTAPVAGASVALTGGRTIGETASNGLLRLATPEELLRPLETPGADADGDAADFEARFLTVRAVDGRRLLVPLGLPMDWAYHERTSWSYYAGEQRWWVAAFTDRSGYRRTDTIHVSGTIRARADRSVPDAVDVRLRAWQSPPEAAIVRTVVEPSRRGVFVADLRLDALPRGSYFVDLFVGKDLVSSMWVDVTEIRKPAYTIDVTTDRRVYLDGERVDASTAARFYEGSPVPGLKLRFNGFGDEKQVTTSAVGSASTTFTAGITGRREGWSYESIGAAPVNPEEGQISGERWLMVLPSRSWLAATGTIKDGRIVVTGTLSRVDLAALERAIATDAELDPAGAAIAGGSIEAVVVHEIPQRRKVGTSYDFVEKRVVPVYEYTTRNERIATPTLTSAADGTFRLSLAAPVPEDSYVVTLTASDARGRTIILDVYVTKPDWRDPSQTRLPYLETLGWCGSSATLAAGIDEPFDVTMRAGDGSPVANGSVLFLVGALGSMEATIQDSATFARTLRDADLPGLTIRAVWLSARGYFVADVDVAVDPADKTITVTLRPDKARYRPGGTVNVGITTTDSSGRPIAADIVLQGVDEKLYTLGLATDLDPLGSLLAATGPGFRDAYRSHGVPMEGNDGGCGDTGGGDERSDFRDAVTFQRVSTGTDGRGTATFKLSDDLTSWRLTATAYSATLDAGVGTVSIPVGLPFFAEAVLAPEYLVGEDPVLLVRGYGDGLEAGDSVRFTVSSESLGLQPTTVQAAAFIAARVPLPSLSPGDHQVRIEAEVRDGDTVRRDVLIRTVHVASSRLSTLSTMVEPLGSDFVPRGGDGLTRFVVTDAGRGRLLDLLNRLASARSARLDRGAAADLARTVLITEYDVPQASLPTTGFDGGSYEGCGLRLLPYSSPDLELTAKVALVAPQLVSADVLSESLRDWSCGEESSAATTRERTIVALAGRAGLGDDVLDELLAYDRTTLTIKERLWLGLGIAAAGDELTARLVERDLLGEAGQRLGPWVRLLGPTAAETLDASALMLLLAGRLGDPLAHDIATYLAASETGEHLVALEEIGYVQAALERLPRNPARFAWTVDGQRHAVELPAGGSFSLVLTRSQWTGLRLEPLEGDLAVATTAESAASKLPADPQVAIERTITPSRGAPADGLVRVSIHVTFGPQLPRTCYRLTDLVPSGMVALWSAPEWYDDEEGTVRNGPYEVDGQRVSWCTSPEDPDHDYEYLARVVTPGTYRWEPAVLQWEEGPSLGTSTPETTYVIR